MLNKQRDFKCNTQHRSDRNAIEALTEFDNSQILTYYDAVEGGRPPSNQERESSQLLSCWYVKARATESDDVRKTGS